LGLKLGVSEELLLFVLAAVHHIDYCKTNCDPENLISLCLSCHAKTGAGKRHVWVNFFDNLKNGNALEVVNV